MGSTSPLCTGQEVLLREGDLFPFLSALFHPAAPRNLRSAGEDSTRRPGRGGAHVTGPVARRHNQGAQRLLFGFSSVQQSDRADRREAAIAVLTANRPRACPCCVTCEHRGAREPPEPARRGGRSAAARCVCPLPKRKESPGCERGSVVLGSVGSIPSPTSILGVNHGSLWHTAGHG